MAPAFQKTARCTGIESLLPADAPFKAANLYGCYGFPLRRYLRRMVSAPASRRALLRAVAGAIGLLGLVLMHGLAPSSGECHAMTSPGPAGAAAAMANTMPSSLQPALHPRAPGQSMTQHCTPKRESGTALPVPAAVVAAPLSLVVPTPRWPSRQGSRARSRAPTGRSLLLQLQISRT